MTCKKPGTEDRVDELAATRREGLSGPCGGATTVIQEGDMVAQSGSSHSKRTPGGTPADYDDAHSVSR